MKRTNNSQEKVAFENILLAIIYDPKTKKILVGRRENDPHVEKLTWCFPGGRLSQEDVEDCLKNKVKLKTGYEVSNLGAVFAKTYPEKKDLFAVYYLCEVTGGEKKSGDDLVELKWVNPEELETLFTTSFHPNLKEYILNLK